MTVLCVGHTSEMTLVLWCLLFPVSRVTVRFGVQTRVLLGVKVGDIAVGQDNWGHLSRTKCPQIQGPPGEGWALFLATLIMIMITVDT